MSLSYQVTFDCADPDRLAGFWAAALGFKRSEPPAGYSDWGGYLTSIGVPESKWGDWSVIVDPVGNSSRIFFQRVPEPKAVKNRVHLDIDITTGMGTPIKERRRLVERVHQYHGYFVILLDPEGNEFCAH